MCFQLFYLWCANLWPDKVIVLKKSFLHPAIRELHPSKAILYTAFPLTLVTRAVLPIHLTVAVPLIVLVATLVVVATLPGEETHAILLVVFVGTLVHIAVLVIESLLPFALAVLQPIFELSYVDTTILPLILALALRLAHVIRSCEAISVRKDVSALPMLKTALPFTFVPVPIFPLVHTVAGSF